MPNTCLVSLLYVRNHAFVLILCLLHAFILFFYLFFQVKLSTSIPLSDKQEMLSLAHQGRDRATSSASQMRKSAHTISNEKILKEQLAKQVGLSDVCMLNACIVVLIPRMVYEVIIRCFPCLWCCFSYSFVYSQQQATALTIEVTYDDSQSVSGFETNRSSYTMNGTDAFNLATAFSPRVVVNSAREQQLTGDYLRYVPPHSFTPAAAPNTSSSSGGGIASIGINTPQFSPAHKVVALDDLFKSVENSGSGSTFGASQSGFGVGIADAKRPEKANSPILKGRKRF
jgi:hypothetical protein